MSDNVIYHDFSQPEMDIVFTPESEEPLFTGSYDVQPCLFGYEVVMEVSWMSKPFTLPKFYSKEWVAQRAGRVKLDEMIEELDSQLDITIEGILDDD